jgi:hypothetical protein
MYNDIDVVLGDHSQFNHEYCAEPFSPEAADFCAQLSRKILKDPRARQYPDLITFGFFCRKANISSLAAQYMDDQVRLGRGTVFHVAPANIPVNYAFSFLFSLLAGNGNIVRLPSREFPQVDLANELIAQLLAAPQFSELASATLFFRSARDHKFIDECVAQADGLMIWGGDRTIELFRTKKRSPRCVELAFPDRYSACIINAAAIADLQDPELAALAHKFFNDTFLVDQNACSSPRLVYWLGGDVVVAEAQDRFWAAVEDYALHHYSLNGVSVVDKVVGTMKALQVYPYAALSCVSNYVFRIGLSALDDRVSQIQGGFGLFVEASGTEISPLLDIADARFQTLTHFGCDSGQLVAAIKGHRVRGIDRVVPVGSALEIGPIWDGHDTVRVLSRVISG